MYSMTMNGYHGPGLLTDPGGQITASMVSDPIAFIFDHVVSLEDGVDQNGVKMKVTETDLGMKRGFSLVYLHFFMLSNRKAYCM